MKIYDNYRGRPLPFSVQLIELIEFYFYYERNPSGGWLHIALVDGSLEYNDIRFCQQEAENHGDWLGLFIANRLCDMTYEERDQIRNKIHNGEGIK